MPKNKTPILNKTEKKSSTNIYDDKHFSLIRTLQLADFITELNGFCGIMSVFSSMKYCLGDPLDTTWLWKSMTLMPLGLCFDFLDGRVARWRKKSSPMGRELDSLADLVSFGIAPSVFAFALGIRTLIDSIILSFFVLCGISRLARFNISVDSLPKNKYGKLKYFEGTPIPTTLSIVAMMAWWVRSGWILEKLPFGVIYKNSFFEFHPAAIVFALSGCAMCSKTLKVRKI
ncbi:CDP-diacylglycerol-serine O-phosphatidyltransferase [Pneumocystis murina B123]|uniref:CDP-diacylglycerol--serine O-phosphatidyltransferase n=1 Tax=Pneumocystis murina (strain B123) TaxID=1069680 RepID=M7NX19_PNEMU|nr:CDP-diacylglycerol-serine O-phosphatidyltransferase [Pneumocystis murina B123]EMR11832.1 CDP-diacylglycerol-serine O-phosphatidyltransferase [Pneumocystis murina B123]